MRKKLEFESCLLIYTSKLTRFHCDVCSCDCTNLVRIRCAECADYDLCVQCFAQGASSGTHKPWHGYMIIEQHAYPIFDEDWGADEELSLIEGAQTCGLGNWQDIADHVGGRSKEEVEAHYTKLYLESPDYPLADMSKEFDTSASEFAERRRQRLEARRNAVVSIIPKQKPAASVPSCHEIQGYMPGRLEFEQEAENDAELPIKDMVFDGEDSELDVDLKLTVLDIYNSRLTTRTERKRTILSHNLLDYRRLAAIDKKRTKEERDMYTKLKPFARIMTKDDFENFSESMMSELKLRRRIIELQEYRRAGIRTLDMAAKYERDKAVRMSAINKVFPLSGPNAVPTAASASLAGLNGSAGPNGMLGSSVGTGSMGTRASSVSAASAGVAGAGSTANGSATGMNGAMSSTTTSTKFSRIQIPAPSEVVTVNGGSSGSTPTIRIKKPSGNPSDIANAPDVELLSPSEQQLCVQLRLMPKPYMAIKEVIFRELTRTGGTVKKKALKELLKIDTTKCNRIFDFFQNQNWM